MYIVYVWPSILGICDRIKETIKVWLFVLIASENPECKGLMNTKKQVESTFQSVYPHSKIDCKPASNCSG